MKRLRVAFGLLFCFGGVQLEAQLVDGVKAVVAESPVTYVEVAERSSRPIETLSHQYSGEVLQQRIFEVETNELEYLVSRQLILQEFKTYNVPETILDKDVDKRIQEIVHERFYGDRMRMIKTLQAEGTTLERFRKQIREQFIEVALRNKNVSSEIIISPHKIESYYQVHREEFKLEDEVKLRMIVLNRPTDVNAPDPKKLGEDILSKLQEGAAFEEMAKVYSQGSQASRGGDWGWYATGKLRKEFAEASSKLKPGERSGLIEASDGFYIMLVEEKKPVRYKTLAEVREEIEKNLRLDETSRLEKQWVARLKKKTFVKFF
jgi:parvulin-like peptidyl-prolyl isomerase